MFRLVIFTSLFLYCFGAVHFATRTGYDGRIVGGSPANITNYPYQVSLEYRLLHDCGASVISVNWAVTAAHCTHDRPPSLIRLRAGTSLKGIGGSLHPASEIVEHPEYWNADYDIAVIKVSVPFEFRESVQPIPMNSVNLPFGTQVVVTGWGRLQTGGTSQSQLQQVQVNVMDYEECNSAYWEYEGITPRMLCAGVTAGGKDSCQGDSGGPLMANGKLSGIVSWGDDCGRAGFPGVYTNVAVLKNWVTSVTGVE
ncbi:trypsin-1-like [Zootermopsis nevadensis]|uniref:trypsin-1-like n=1 Tax=Zootermopsis nevadensis TaxID=136037 RepID=UPI000B8E3423|nr:trypsin-1-like [Zootermopsis nevadensis]